MEDLHPCEIYPYILTEFVKMEDLHPCEIYPYILTDCYGDCDHCTIGNPYFDYGDD